MALAAVTVALLSACAQALPAAHQAGHVSTGVTVRGLLTAVQATTLTVQDTESRRTVRVTFAPMATPIYAVTVANETYFQPGSCVTATAQRDPTGMLVASGVMVASSYNDRCPAGSVPLPPTPAAPGMVTVAGQVLGVGGMAIILGGAAGTDPTVMTVPPGVPILAFQPSGRTALGAGTCVVVHGTTARRGAVVAADKIVDWPPQTVC